MAFDLGSVFGNAMQGYSQGTQQPGKPQPFQLQPMQQGPTPAQQQLQGIAAGEAARNASLSAAVQNLNAAQSLGQQGPGQPPQQSMVGQPAAIDQPSAMGAPSIVVPNPAIRPRPYPQQPNPGFQDAANYFGQGQGNW
jgi:hypothetical protein